MNLTALEIGWLAGFLEGEGYFGHNKCSSCIKVKTTDEDVIIKYSILVTKIIGKRPHIGYVDRSSQNPNWKDAHVIDLSGDNAKSVMRIIVKHMSKRRRIKIWQSLNNYGGPKKHSLASLKTMLGGIYANA